VANYSEYAAHGLFEGDGAILLFDGYQERIKTSHS